MTRCAAALYLRRHDVMAKQKRDETGRVVRPHVLIWECRRCGHDVATTALSTKWNLLAEIRRQLADLRRKVA